MIVAKAANIDLVVLAKHNENWIEVNGFPEWCMENYFLCLPQHKEACLHWLNGGEVQQKPIDNNHWVTCADVNKVTWMSWTSFMQDKLEFRIKPKKEKRFIAWNSREDAPEKYSYCTLSLAQQAYKDQDVQIIEIEVEA